MKVIFDFDDVIFDTARFKEFIFVAFERKGYTDVRSKYEVVRKNNQPFSLETFIAEVLNDTKESTRKDLYEEAMSYCPQCINPHVHALMQKLGRENCYIVTNGIDDFQKDKIRRSIGEESVQEVIVVSGGKLEAVRDLCQKYSAEEVIFVDDKREFLHNLDMESCPNLKTVLFNEHGMENFMAEIAESQRQEREFTQVSDSLAGEQKKDVGQQFQRR